MLFLYEDLVLYLLIFLLLIYFVAFFIVTFSDELNWLFNDNVLLLIVLLFFSIIILFSGILSLYNIAKYSKINNKNVFGMLLISIFLLFIVNEIIKFDLGSNLITFLKVLKILFLLVFTVSIPFALLSLNRQIEPNPLKNYFIKAQSKLDRLLKDSQESMINKNLADVFDVVDSYDDGIKEIKNSFGKVIYFNNIINSSTRKSLTEILDQLTFSIPFYIFYGEIEQMKEMDTHIENINKCLGDTYSMAGGPFMTEILRMNEKVDKYFKENSFELSKIENTHIGKYDYYKKQIFLVLLTIVSSIILSKLVGS